VLRRGNGAGEEGRRKDGLVAGVFEAAVKPGQAAAVRALIENLVASARGEPGVLAYGFLAGDDGAAVAHERCADSVAGLALADPTRVTVLASPSEEFRGAAAAFGLTYLCPVGGFVR
jgi:hypothetical protein